MDGPEEIVAGALKEHRRMVREFRGVPGVQPMRLAEGLQVRRHECRSPLGPEIFHNATAQVCLDVLLQLCGQIVDDVV